MPPSPGRVYVIGDIHGRADLLEGMIVAIARDLEAAQSVDCLTTTLGDYIDRGPDSRKVVERLADNPFPMRFVALKGNHEALLENFLVDPSVGEAWRRVGGLETLHSYGVDVGPMMQGRGYEAAAAAFRAALPQAHRDFFSSLETSLTLERYFLCHAGVRPNVPLARQNDDDLLWIRDEFLRSETDFGKIVVHGHTPTEKPEICPNRINIDTGAYLSGRLTCAVLEGDQVRLLTAS
jgi:calcineurin-like phosphoesterase family protein